MEKYSKYSVEDFTTDSKFINWILYPDNVSDNYWKSVVAQYPAQQVIIEEAIFLINSIKAENSSIPKESLEKIRINIQKQSVNKKRLKLYVYMRWAAILVILLGSAILIPRFTKIYDSYFADAYFTPVDNAQIILADGSTKSIDLKESEIKIKSSGDIIVNNDTLKTNPDSQNKAKLNHVVMPYGKQSSLQLPDGTTVYINAGSRLSFPTVFTGSKREVYLIGEALFKVKSNKQKPFIVHTPEVNITATGTEFNVSAYSDDTFTQTVLVTGKVSVSKNTFINKKREIKPGESAMFDKNTGLITTHQVDTDQYVSWIHSFIICKNDLITDVIKKIERYYNKEISVDENITNITFSGKLDLNENVINALESITYASSLKMEITNNMILIKK